MTPAEYVHEVARPNVEDFLANPLSRRHAVTAAISLYHFADYRAAASGLPLSDVQTDLQGAMPSFAILRDVANAGKHCKLKRGQSAGTSVEQVRSGAGAAFSDGSYFDDGSTFDDAQDVILFEKDGQPYDLTHVFADALRLIESRLP